MKILDLIDKRIDKLKLNKNFNRNNHHLVLSQEEYKTLKDSLTEINEAEILTYRGLFVRIKKGKK